MKRLVKVAAAVVLIGTLKLQAVPWSGGIFSGTLVYRNTYDSNLLRYSARDRQRFLDEEERNPSPISTLDDLRTDLKATVAYTFNLWPELDSKAQATVNFAHHLMNPIKNFGWLSLTARQELSRQWTASANYFYEPAYYIRDYYDIHTSTHHHCEFALGQWQGTIGCRPVRAWEFSGFGKFKRYAYSEFFTEYDGDLVEFGGEVIFRSGAWRLSGGYSLAVNQNVGFESSVDLPPGEVDEDSEIGQGDYDEDGYAFSTRYSFRVSRRRAWVELEVKINDRYYTTDRYPDPIHHGRHDLVASTELSGRWYLTRAVRLEIGAAYYSRESSASDPVVSRVKDYARRTGWIELCYQFL